MSSSNPPKPRRRPSRRLLVGALAASAVLTGGAGTAFAVIYTSVQHDTAGKVVFDQPLPIPPLAKSTVSDGTRTYRLDLRRGQTSFGRGLAGSTFYGQDATAGAAPNSAQYLAPTLRAARDERVRIQVKNGLGTTSSLHWHGMHLPAKMDGGPHQPIAAGSTWTPSWQIRQPAATLWYHPHPHGATEQQVAKGLAGLFLLEDPKSTAAKALPHEYGVDDVPVVVQDKSFDGAGRPKGGSLPSFLRTTGTLGDQALANGKVGATFTATTELVRLRLVNGSTARIYNLGFSDDRAFQIVGTDGGLLDAPKLVKRVTMSPGDRSEIVVAVKPGDRTILRNFPVHLAGFPNQRQAGGDDTLDILQLRGAARVESSPPVPQHLADIPRVDVGQAVTRRAFALEIPEINNKSMDMHRIDFAVTAGTDELWTVSNRDGMPHNFHVHGVDFRVLSVNGQEPPIDMQGLQDTVLVKPGDSVRFLISFPDNPDPSTPYMFHCHLLWHEDAGMMGQFVMVSPGATTTN